jgi:hypothetical protein
VGASELARATLEIMTRHGMPFPAICDLALRNNKDAPPEMWWAAHKWISDQDFSRLEIKHRHGSIFLTKRKRWRALWRNYWLSKKAIPDWLPLRPNASLFGRSFA